MAQVVIYLPDDVEVRTRRDAKRSGKSLSAYIVSKLDQSLKKEKLERLWGSCPELKAADDSDLLPLRDISLRF